MKPNAWRTAVAVGLALALASIESAKGADDVELTGSIVVGGETIDDPRESSKFQEYREVPNGFLLESLTFGLKKSDWTLDVRTVDLLQQDERIEVALRSPGSLRAWLGYDQTPKWISNTAATLYTRNAEGRFILPLPMRQQLQGLGTGAATRTALEGYLEAAQPLDLRYRRDTTSAGVRWSPGNWAFDAGFLQENRHGSRPLTSSTYFSTGGDVIEFASPIDYTTQTGRASLEYATAAYNVGAEVVYTRFTDDLESRAGGSVFENAIIVDNPLRFTDASGGPNGAGALFLISAPPDTTSAWANLSGGFRVGGWGRVSARFSVGRNEQDDVFLPFSLNTAVPAPADPRGLVILEGNLATGVPVTRYDGRIDTTVYDVRFTGRPASWFSFKAFAHSYDYDNETPEYTVTDYIRNDTGLEGIPRAALPFAWQKDNAGADVSFRPVREFGVSLGFEREAWDREFRNAPKTDEDIFRVGVDWSPGPWTAVRARYRNGDRKHDDYDEEHYFGEESYPSGEPVANAVILEQRLFDLANRQQDRIDFSVQLTPPGRFSFGASVYEVENDYDDTTVVDNMGTPELRAVKGRLRDRSAGWALDVAVSATDALTITADYGEETLQTLLASRYRPVSGGVAIDDPLNDWFSRMTDKTKTYGLGFDASLVPGRWFLEIRGLISDSTGRTRASSVPGGVAQGEAVDFPDVTNKLTHALAEVRWRPFENFTLGVGYIFERWETEDFARGIVRTALGGVDGGAGESIYLGWRIPRYEVNLFRVLTSYRF